MGKTIEDVKRECGMSDKTFIESHYGVKPKWFFLIAIIWIIAIIAVATTAILIS